MATNDSGDHRSDSDSRMLSTSATPDLGTLLLDLKSGKLLACDSPARALLGSASASVSEATLSNWLPELSLSQLAQLYNQNDKYASDFLTQGKTSKGDLISVAVRLTPLFGTQPSLLLLTIFPSSQHEAVATCLDALTGLPDRRALVSRFENLTASGSESRLPFALLFMDLDQFKSVNDKYGHHAGDEVLATLAKRWQSCVRDGDLVVRYGGDEFVVLLTDISSRDSAQPAIARLAELTSQPIPVGKKHLTLTVTIGLALSTEHSDDLLQLISAADREMYAGKTSK